VNTDQLIAKRAACGCCHGRAGVIIDGKEWKLVPVEATQAMLDAAEKIDWSGEDVLGNCCNQWYAMLAAAPPAPVVEVTKATCAVSTCWAPHVDDGDNSRMRTKLRIDVLWVYAENGDAVGVECSVMRHHGDRFFTMRARWIEMLADHNNDPDAALRLCALRVAAQMGEQM